MPLSHGARLGPYEIVAPLGAGGMGEVYKARDTRLDRTVAIKIIPPPLAGDPQRRERFRREARAISSLSHPHICTLHDIGEDNGAEFLVMEYLDGETLAHRLRRGALPLDQVLRIAAQIAGALDAAHRRGVMHRDLKPSNVMLTASGAKVVDFGLAKLQRADPDTPSPVEGQLTAHSTLTHEAAIVGTVQYMAPEQLEGKPADARADIFALGAIVYEMATGRRAFEGTSNASVIAAILSATPPPMSTLQAVVPSALDHVVKDCLAKDPDARWQSAGDVERELRWIADAASVSSTVPLRRSGRALPYWLGATVLIALVTGVSTFLFVRAGPTDASRVQLVIPPPEHTAYSNANLIESPPVISPDGRQVAFVAHTIGQPDAVWVRSLDSLAAHELPGTHGIPSSSLWVFWSPDSRSLGFFSDGKLKRVDLAGGPPQVLADAPDGRGGTWNRQGIIVFAPTADGPLNRVPAAGGPVTPATTIRPPQVGHRWPVFLPDGRHFLYVSRVLPQLRDTTVDIASLDSTEVVHALSGGTTWVNAAYSATGHLLFVRGDTLFAQRFDPERRVALDGPAAVVEKIGSDGGSGAMFSIAPNGTLIYRRHPAPTASQLAWVDRSGQTVSTIGTPDTQDGLSLSPDGTHVALRRVLAGRDDIWIQSSSSAGASRLTLGSGNFSPVWSPDGRQVAFGTQRHDDNLNGVFRQSASGAGQPEALVLGKLSTAPTDWSRDGRFIVYWDQDATTKADLWALPLGGDRKPIPLVRTAGEDSFGQLSPDGRWLAYTSDVSGREEVYVQAFPTPSGKWQVSMLGGTQPRWRSDGSELFYVSAQGQVTAATVVAGADGIDVSMQKRLFSYHSGGEDYGYAVSADGQRFLVNSVVSDTSQPIVVVLNWAAALK